MIEDIPTVRSLLPVPLAQRDRPGVIYGHGTPAEIGTKAKYVVMAMANDLEAKGIAERYENIIMDDANGLWIKGMQDDARAFTLECYKIPRIRAVFDALDLKVCGGE